LESLLNSPKAVFDHVYLFLTAAWVNRGFPNAMLTVPHTADKAKV
jgi:hypothetical protein